MSVTVFATLMLLGASIYDGEFATAVHAYDNGDYQDAVRTYERLIADDVVDPVVFYNLGNAYYRLGRLAPAIANYERALQIHPGFEEAESNLARAVGDTRRRLNKPLPPAWEQSLLFWHYNLSQRITKLLAVAFWSVFWVLGMIRLRISRKVLTYAVVATGLLACAFGASAWMKAHPVQLAVARQPVAPVHYGMNDDETVRFELYEGDRVVVDAVRNDWARVTTVDGERGWTRTQNLILVGPPYSAPPQTTGESTPEHDKLETQ